MAVAFIDVIKCMVFQRNHFKSNTENYNATGLLRGNRSLAQKNRKMELRSADKNKEHKGEG